MASKGGGAETVKVIVRCRPLNTKETEAGYKMVVDMDTTMGTIKIRNPTASAAEEPKMFTFDTVYDWTSKQLNVYQGTAAPIVESVLSGYNGTVLAYGQTGTGKTFTMEGVRANKELKGIIPNSFEHIFDKIHLSTGVEFLVRVSYLEIYNENIRDLLGPDPRAKMDLKEHPDKGVYVKDLSAIVVKGADEMDRVMNLGNSNRTVGATNMNAQSSRSHSIFTITVETSTPTPDGGKPTIRAGKLHLVDLAGSERQDKTGATGVRLKEPTKINLSLSALGNVISALVDGNSSHIPYRDSKLTRLLQDSLGGNSRTVMVANLGPAEYNYDETLSTLRYANRAKNIKNKPKVNEDPKDALLRQFQDEIERLKEELQRRAGGGGPASLPQVANGLHPRVYVSDGVAIEKLRQSKEAEMRALLQQKDLAAGEKKRIEEELQASTLRAAEEAKEDKELEARMKEIQNKTVGGRQQLIDETEKQQAMLRRAAAELEAKVLAETALKRQLAEKQENMAAVEERYTSMQQENDVKTKKLRRLVEKYKEAKNEIRDLQSEWQREKEDMLDSVRDLTNQLKLKMMIISNFIPKDEAVRTERRSIWDEEKKIWKIAPMSHVDEQHLKAKRPISAVNYVDGTSIKRPISEYARAARLSNTDNPRFKTENIITLELDMPERTTADFNEQLLAQAREDVAPSRDMKMRGSSKGRPGTASLRRSSGSGRDEAPQEEEEFPQARGGLVSRRR